MPHAGNRTRIPRSLRPYLSRYTDWDIPAYVQFVFIVRRLVWDWQHSTWINMYGKQHPHASNWSTRAHSKRLSITHDVTEASHAIQKSHLILVRMQELCHTTRMRTAYLETRTHYVGQSCNAFDSYSEGVRFESRLGHRIYWGLSWLFSFPIGKFRYSTYN
jgi:hypothetical protein